MCSLETDEGRFGPFSDLVSLWRQRVRPNKSLPRRADFEMENFRNWLGRIFIAKVERDPFNLRFTLWGTQLVDWWKVDYTNKTLGSLSSNPTLWKFSEIRYFQEMDRAPFIGISAGQLTQHGRQHIKVMAIDLPLSDASGISHVLSAHMLIGMNDDLETMLPDCPITVFT